MGIHEEELEFPEDIQRKIDALMQETGWDEDTAINNLMRAFFYMVENKEEKNVPEFVLKVRKAICDAKKSGMPNQSEPPLNG